MKDSIRSNFIRKLLRLGRLQRRILLAFAGLVVALTTYALMTPAITLESEYLCGKEAHVHGPSCYEADAETGELTLICDKEEHIHDERCIVHDKNPERYICGHDYEHTHDESCYRNGELICTLVEHTHTESCLADEYRYYMRASSAAELPENPEFEAVETVEEVETAGQTPPADGVTEGAVVEAQSADGEPSAESVEAAEGQESEPSAESFDSEPGADAEQRRGLLPEESSGGEGEENALLAQPGEEQEDGEQSASEEIDEDDIEGFVTASALTEGATRAIDQTFQLTNSANTTITFSITKDGVEYDLAFMEGGGYAFTLSINTNQIQPTNANFIRRYYYDLDEKYKGCTLYYGDKDLVDYCASFTTLPTNKNGQTILNETGWAPLKSKTSNETIAYLKATRTDEGLYRFTFIAPDTSVRSIDVTGQLSRGQRNNTLGIVKTYSWDTATESRKFNIAVTIPHFVDDYSQYYYIQDVSSAKKYEDANTPVPIKYSGFYENVGNETFANAYGSAVDFTVTVTDNVTGQTYTAVPVNQANANDQFAYLLVTEDDTTMESGKKSSLYLFNRSVHKDSHNPPEAHPDDHDVALYSNYDYHCLCWQQEHDVTINISYNDLYGRKYLLYEEDENTANVDGQTVLSSGQHRPVTDLPPDAYISSTGTLQKVASKKYDDDTHTFTLDINPNRLNFGNTPITITDTMTNATVLGSVTVNRLDANDAIVYAGLNYEYTPTGSDPVTGEVTDFTITIYNPGNAKYQIIYSIERIDSQTADVGNAYSMDYATSGPQINSWDKSWEFGISAATGYEFTITLQKEYEGGIPPVGAEFTLYQAITPAGDSDIAIGVSKTVAATSTTEAARNEYYAGYEDYGYMSTYPYPAANGLDKVIFDNVIMFTDTIYYIKETYAPDDYVLNPDVYYFYFTTENSLYSGYLQDGFNGSTSASGRSPQEVAILNDWHVENNTNVINHIIPGAPMVNTKFKYTFPETGSSVGLLLRTTGVVLMLSPALLLMNKKRNKKQATSPEQPELH